MPQIRPRWLNVVMIWCVIALIHACAIKPEPLIDVGAVVQPNKLQLSPVPTVVQQTLPERPGYFQERRLARAQSIKGTPTLSEPTKSTSLMQAAEPTPSPSGK